MESVATYLDRIARYMDQRPADQWMSLESITKHPQRFIDAIKYLIDFENKPYEFNTNYTKVRRIEYVATKTIKPNQNAK